MRKQRANSGLHEHVLSEITRSGFGRDSRIVDFGCGSGTMLEELRHLGYGDLIGFDISPPKLDGIDTFAVDLDAFRSPIPQNSVDLIVAVELIEHIENVGVLMWAFDKLLTQEGRVLITTPNVHSVEARLRFLLRSDLKQFDLKGDPTHITPIFLFPFRRLVARYGFEIEHAWGFPVDGSSPTTMLPLRFASALVKLFGVTAKPSGDNLCLWLRRNAATSNPSASQKAELLTAHYT